MTSATFLGGWKTGDSRQKPLFLNKYDIQIFWPSFTQVTLQIKAIALDKLVKMTVKNEFKLMIRKFVQFYKYIDKSLSDNTFN